MPGGRALAYGPPVIPASATERFRVLHKSQPEGPAPNMPDYDRARAEFSWAAARARLAGLPGGGLNIAYEAVDRHADGPLADTVALRFLSKRHRGVGAHLRRPEAADRSVCGRARRAGGEGAASACSCSRAGFPSCTWRRSGRSSTASVFCPLFSAFGPEPIEQRLRLGDARVLVTTTALYRRKVAELAPSGCPASSTCCSSASARRSPRFPASRTSAR